MKRGVLAAAAGLPLLAAALYFSVGVLWQKGRDNPVVLEAAAGKAPDGTAQLRFRIGELDLGEIAGERNFAAGDPVYVTLRPGRPFWRAVSVCRGYPVVPQGDAALRGQVVAVGDRLRGLDGTGERTTHGPVLTVRYGIENAIMADGGMVGPVAVRLAIDPAGVAGVASITDSDN